MKLHVLYDQDGRILAASQADAPDGVVPIPVASQANHTVSELEVPAEHAKGELDEICRRLRVDPQRKMLVAGGYPGR